MITSYSKDYVLYIDTDSVYFSAEPLAEADKPADMTKYTINLVTEVADTINRFYEYMVPKVFNVAPEKNRIKIVPDVVAEKALWMAKKRYAMLKVYDMEKKRVVKSKDGSIGKLEVKGIDTVRSSFPKAFQKVAGEILEMLLRGVDREILDEKIMRFEETMETHSIFDLGHTTSVKFISTNGENNYNPSTRRLFQYITKTPAGVKAALNYNDLLKIWKLDKKIEKIMSGNKVKWVYLLPNDFGIKQLAMKADDTDPDEILKFVTEHIDRVGMYEHELYKKLAEIYKVINWPWPSRAAQLAQKTFNFKDIW